MNDIAASSYGLNGLPGKPTQAGVIPFRGVGDGAEFCLITTRKSGRWCFPKGKIPRGMSLEQAGLLEALEEAGLDGQILNASLGGFSYRKRNGFERIEFMLMEVSGERTTWKEVAERERRWVSASQAITLLSKPPLIRLLLLACRHLEVNPLAIPSPQANDRLDENSSRLSPLQLSGQPLPLPGSSQTDSHDPRCSSDRS